MTVRTKTGGRRELNNLETLTAKRGVNPIMIYNLNKHRYIGSDGRQHFTPYTRGKEDR